MTMRLFALLALAVTLPAQVTLFPTLTALNPATAPVGTPGLSLTVTGSNFFTGAVVSWNDIILSTTSFVGTTQLTAAVPAFLLSAPGSARIVVSNPGGARSNTLNFSITGSPVSITTTALPEGSVGSAYMAVLTASGGASPYAWRFTGTLPPGLTVNSGGEISGTPSTAGTFGFEVQVTDAGNQTASRALSITIAAPPLSITTASPLPRGMVGQTYSQALAAANGAAPFRWAVGAGLPAGLTLNATTGAITGTPAASGSFTFSVQVTDARDTRATRTFTLTIDPPPLTITTVSPLFSATVGSAYAQTLAASGGVAPYRWAIVSGDAGGLTLDATSGVLQGTPSAAGTISLTVRVTDNSGATATRAFSITVNPVTLTVPTPSTLPGGTVGTSYTQVFTVVGGTAPYTWSLISGNVPGLTFDPAPATLSGTPTAAGSFTFALSVRDTQGNSTTRTFTVSITSSALRITSEAQLPDATLAASFSHAMTATGGSAPYTWSSTGLPEGLAIDSATGLISGTPMSAGSYSFTVRVTDNARATFIELFRLMVNLPPAPGATISGLPETADPAQQFPLRISLNDIFPAPISGQAILSFAPESGGGDNTIQFASGGRTVDFTVPAETREAATIVPLALQTGTVAGTITVSVRLRAGGIDITPNPAPTARVRIERKAPVIRSARLIRNANGFGIEIIGSSTAREVTQASFTFTASGGQSLQSSTVVVPVEDLFSRWYQDSASSEFGSQFVFTQSFNVQGDAAAVIPQSVTLTNRIGSATAQVTQ